MLRQAFDGKFFARVNAIQAALPHLYPDGSVTMITAASARAAFAGAAGLTAANGALEAMVAPLAVELAPLRVNAVFPGIIGTLWWHAMLAFPPVAAGQDQYGNRVRVRLGDACRGVRDAGPAMTRQRDAWGGCWRTGGSTPACAHRGMPKTISTP